MCEKNNDKLVQCIDSIDSFVDQCFESSDDSISHEYKVIKKKPKNQQNEEQIKTAPLNQQNEKLFSHIESNFVQKKPILTNHPTTYHMSVSLCRAINYEQKKLGQTPYFNQSHRANFKNLKSFLKSHQKFKQYLESRRYEDRLKGNNKTRTDFKRYYNLIVEKLLV